VHSADLSAFAQWGHQTRVNQTLSNGMGIGLRKCC